MCIAIGHDLIEDTKTTFQELIELGFSDRVIDGIRALTKMPGETHEEYKAKVKRNADSVKVKKCDLRHNTDIRRLKSKTISDKDLQRVKRYHEFYIELEELDESEVCDGD
jgi:(p)ppGpp synthase/HD superfamily hydrolase